jgi:AbrB family looped-hinge helix DNA binding protein
MPNIDNHDIHPLKIAVQQRNLISLPKEIRKKLNIQEGDMLEAWVEEGKIIIEPYKLIPASQAYFWSNQTQKDMQEAREDAAESRLREFSNAEEFLKGLDNGS